MGNALICWNEKCKHAMLLPRATNPEDQNNLSWPKGHDEFSFLCPSCRRAYVYKIHDVRHGPDVTASDLKVFRLAVPCPEKGCKGHLEMRTLLPSDCRDPWQEFQNFLKERSSFASPISCSSANGHVLPARRIECSGPRDCAGLDELWS